MSPVDIQYVDKTNWVINLSSRSLSDADITLLKKELNFAVTPANIPDTEINRFIRSRMTSRLHRLKNTSSMQSKRRDLHHT